MSTETELLPERAVLVHIGPYKTGTTAIQSSLHEHRAELPRPGSPTPAATTARCARAGPCSVAAASVRPTYRPPSGTRWSPRYVVRPGRVVISSEDFSSARPERARKLVDDLGADLVHVLIVARRLDKLLPSAWQERVKSVNETRTYDTWLREVLAKERTGRRGQGLLAQPRPRRPDRALARGPARRSGSSCSSPTRPTAVCSRAPSSGCSAWTKGCSLPGRTPTRLFPWSGSSSAAR